MPLHRRQVAPQVARSSRHGSREGCFPRRREIVLDLFSEKADLADEVSPQGDETEEGGQSREGSRILRQIASRTVHRSLLSSVSHRISTACSLFVLASSENSRASGISERRDARGATSSSGSHETDFAGRMTRLGGGGFAGSVGGRSGQWRVFSDGRELRWRHEGGFRFREISARVRSCGAVAESAPSGTRWKRTVRRAEWGKANVASIRRSQIGSPSLASLAGEDARVGDDDAAFRYRAHDVPAHLGLHVQRNALTGVGWGRSRPVPTMEAGLEATPMAMDMTEGFGRRAEDRGASLAARSPRLTRRGSSPRRRRRRLPGAGGSTCLRRVR